MTPFVTGVRRSSERRGTVAREEVWDTKRGGSDAGENAGRDEECGGITAD